MPFRDKSGVGFLVYKSSDSYFWRARTIAGVSWNCTDERAVFFNADGMSLPIQADPHNLPTLLRAAIDIRFGVVEGDGQFGIKPAELKAIRNGSSLASWATYRFMLPEQFSNHKECFERTINSDLAGLRRYYCGDGARQAVAISMTHPGQALPTSDEIDAETQRQADACLATERLALWALYEREVAYDLRIAAWLDGRVGGKPCICA